MISSLLRKARINVLAVDYAFGQQAVTRIELLNLKLAGPHLLRLTIKSDAYRHQSHAKIERHDGALWHEVWTILGGAMSTQPGLIYVARPGGLTSQPKASEIEAATADDRATLLERAAQVLLG